MSRFERAFKQKALVAYVCAGDHSLAATAALVPRLAEAGADIIELGVPFSDPIADGPTLQAAAERAILAGTTARKVLSVVREIRSGGCEVPLVLMSYLNPLLSPSLERYCQEAAEAGVDALLLPDLPLEEAEEVRALTKKSGLSLPLLAAPTTPAGRLRKIGAAAEGFLYFVSVTGVTGGQGALPAELPAQLQAARAASRVPVVVGFGISTPEQASALAKHADGVVVGSALVKLLHDSRGDFGPVVELVRRLAKAVHTQS